MDNSWTTPDPARKPETEEPLVSSLGIRADDGIRTRDRTALYAYHAIDSYLYGSLLQQSNLPFETPAEFAEVAAQIMASPSLAEEYPHLAEVVVELTERGFDYQEGFEAGLDLILDAIERLLQQEIASMGST